MKQKQQVKIAAARQSRKIFNESNPKGAFRRLLDLGNIAVDPWQKFNRKAPFVTGEK